MPAKIDIIADTSAIVGLLRRDSVVEHAIGDKNFAITFVTLAELSLGVLKAARPADRALARRDGELIVWSWIGSHEEYNQFTKQLR
jgi:predicted nucleic acid-binding protein